MRTTPFHGATQCSVFIRLCSVVGYLCSFCARDVCGQTKRCDHRNVPAFRFVQRNDKKSA